MTAMLKIGLITTADDSLSKCLVKALSKHEGLVIQQCITAGELTHHHIHCQETVLWIIDVIEEQWNDELDTLISTTNAELYFYEHEALSAIPFFEEWCEDQAEELGEKFNHLLSQEEEKIVELPLANRQSVIDCPIWILAASSGGPQAVQKFLSELSDEVKNMCFILVQHIGSKHLQPWTEVLQEKSHLHVSMITEGCQIAAEKLLIVSGENRPDFRVSGQIKLTDNAWREPYAPSIHDVMHDVLKSYPEQVAGVIFFSGMGVDGAEMCQTYYEKQIHVWTQSDDSCVNNSLPQSVRDTGFATFDGSPEELAQHFFHCMTEINQYSDQVILSV